MSSRISLSDLLAAGVLIRPSEAAAIVAEVCARITRGELRGVPSIHVLRVSNTGDIFAEGPITANRATVARAAQLLEDLIAPADAAPEFRAPGPLRLALLRARGGVDLPPFPGLDAFAAAVARFAPADSPAAVRELYDRWEATVAAPDNENALLPASAGTLLPVRAAESGERELTISDIRRARRATGLTLREVAERSRIPPALLRELEWGYLWNWPGGLYGRTQLVRYARAANLDERLVIEVAWPMLQTVIDARGGDAVRLIPAEESLELLMAPPAMAAGAPSLHAIDVEVEPVPRRRGGLLLATAAAAALIVSPAAFWLHSHRATELAGGSAPASSDVAPSTSSAPTVAEHHTHTIPPAASATSGEPATLLTTNRGTASGPRGNAAAARAVPAVALESPDFSNEGSAVFFRQDADEDGHSALVRADAAPRGTVLKITRVLDDKGHNFHAHPSPDGRRVAFDSDREGTRAVFVADEDGHNVRRVSGDGFAALPSWSPDGGQIAFAKADSERPGVWNLWIADLGTGTQRQLTFNSTGEPWGASWFPDGRRIAYGRDDALIVQDLEGNGSRRYRSPIAGRFLRMPAVSPDGRRIIFQVSGDGAWLLNLANGSMRKVLDDPTAGEYSWAPDGHRVAFHSRRSGGWGVWVMGE